MYELDPQVIEGTPSGGGMSGGGADFLGGLVSNYTNYRIAQMANETQIDLANTAMQRRVKDLAAAGLNPMMAINQGGAATPNMQVARMENPVTSAIATRNASALNSAQVDATTQAAAANSAQARLTNANADLVEAEAVNAAATADQKLKLLTNQANEMAERANKAFSDAGISAETLKQERLNTKQMEVLQPLLTEYQRIVNQASDLGLSEQEATAKFFKDYPWLKGLQILRSAVPSVPVYTSKK